MAKQKFVSVQRFNGFDMATGYYQSAGWQSCIEAFDRWDEKVYGRLDYGASIDHELFERLTETVVDALHATAKVDPMPVWEVYLVLSGRRKATVNEVSHLYQRAQMLHGLVLRAGLGDEQPEEGTEKRVGAPKNPRVEKRRAEVLHQHKEGMRSRSGIAKAITTPHQRVTEGNVRDDLKYWRELENSPLKTCQCPKCVKFFANRAAKSVD